MSVTERRIALLRGAGLAACVALGLSALPARAADTAAPATTAAQPAPATAEAPVSSEESLPKEQPITVNPLLAEKIPNAPGNTLTAVQVVLAPGASMPSHHHAGFVYAYVISGKIKSQLNDGKPKTYKTGQSWTEPPGTRHVMFQNASKKKRAKLLAVFVAPDGADLTTVDK